MTFKERWRDDKNLNKHNAEVFVRGRGSGTTSPVAGSSRTTSLSSSFVSSQRSQGNLYVSFVNVFMTDIFREKEKQVSVYSHTGKYTFIIRPSYLT